MRKATLFYLIVLVPFLIIAASADTAVPETPETQGINTITLVDTLGLATETDELVWQESNWVMNANLVSPAFPLLFPTYHALYTTSYQEDTIADQGLSSYTKSVALDTRGKVENQFNYETQRLVSFIGADSGLLTSDESLLLDGAGTLFPDSTIMRCPFMTGDMSGLTANPPFCNIVDMGSEVSLQEGILTTGTEERHVVAAELQHGEYWANPVSDPGVEENYEIRVSGLGTTAPAEGRVGAYINAHIMEGRMSPSIISYQKCDQRLAEDIVYNEMTTADGTIDLYEKTMSYNSKITGTGFLWVA